MIRVALVLLSVALVAALVWAVLRGREGALPAARPPSARLQSANEEVAVVLDTAALRRAGVETQALMAATSTGGPGVAGAGATAASDASTAIELTGELVADPGRVTTIRPAVPGRLTVPGGRWPALGDPLDAGAVVAQVSDARPLVVPRGGTVTRVSAQPGELVQAGQELLQLTDFTALLARIVWRADAPPAPATIRVAPLAGPLAAPGGAAGIPGRLVGPAAEVDSLTRSPVYVYRVPGGWRGARPGLPITATVSVPLARRTGEARGAVATPARDVDAGQRLLVPADAVVQWAGLAWAYVQRAPGRFVRVRVDTSEPVRGGWIVRGATRATPETLAAGDGVVVRGAQQLLSAEFSSRLPHDEDEKP